MHWGGLASVSIPGLRRRPQPRPDRDVAAPPQATGWEARVGASPKSKRSSDDQAVILDFADLSRP
jgi:hypothetical protein